VSGFQLSCYPANLEKEKTIALIAHDARKADMIEGKNCIK
jgi:hypothetical protein